MSDHRIEKLEMMVTEQERSIEELSKIVTDQWHELQKLSRTLDMLTDRFTELEGHISPDTPNTRPPHW